MLNSEHPGTLKKGNRIYLSVGPQREMLKHRISAHFWQTFWVKRWELDFLYPEIPSWNWILQLGPSHSMNEHWSKRKYDQNMRG